MAYCSLASSCMRVYNTIPPASLTAIVKSQVPSFNAELKSVIRDEKV